MKKIFIALVIGLLSLSLLCNGLLFYYISRISTPYPSVIKYQSDTYDTFIYCETDTDIEYFDIDMQKNYVKIGESKLIKERDALYFIGNDCKTNLCDYDAKGFIINSNGELLYKIILP